WARSAGGREGRRNEDLRARFDQEERRDGVRQTAVLPHRLRRGGLRRRTDRFRRRRKGRPWLSRGREDQARLAPATPASAKEPGEAPAQHAAHRGAGHSARRPSRDRSGGRGRGHGIQGERHRDKCQGTAQRRLDIRRAGRGSARCPSHPAVLRGAARQGLWVDRLGRHGRRSGGDHRALTLNARQIATDSQPKLNPSPTHWPRLRWRAVGVLCLSVRRISMDDLLREFVTETNESLDVVDVELVRFEQDPDNAEILAKVFRLVHTIKGTCGFLGLPRLESLAHAAEALMGRFRDGAKVSPEAVGFILSAIDRIKQILECLEREQREPDGNDDELIGELTSMAERLVVQAPAHTVGTLIEQVLERPLLPGEDSLDDLDRAFRATSVELPAANPRPAAEAKHSDEKEEEAGKLAAQSIRVSV